MGSLRSYPKVYNLGHRAVMDLLSGPVVVQEKVDGSQFSFGAVPIDNENGTELLIRSRGADIEPSAPPKLFGNAVATVLRLCEEGKLEPGFTYRGEVLDKPKHNALAYDRVPVGNIILFDVEGRNDQDFSTPEELAATGEFLGLEVVPIVYNGPGSALSLDMLKEWLQATSILGGQKVEGVVIKAYGRFGLDGKTLMGKHVSEAFKEIAGGEWKAANPKLGDIVGLLIERFRTPARWDKAIQHLRDAGSLVDEPKDIGPLMGELVKDTKEECEAEIRAELFKWGWPRIMRGVQAGFAEYYKEKLAERQFNGEGAKGGVEGESTPGVLESPAVVEPGRVCAGEVQQADNAPAGA